MPKRGRMSPKQKDCTTTNFKNLSVEYFQLVSYCVQTGGESRISKIITTLLNTKRRISFRGSFVLVKGKTFETGGEIFKSYDSFTFDYLQKTLKKNFQNICKNKT
jgi:hypothetical protein